VAQPATIRVMHRYVSKIVPFGSLVLMITTLGSYVMGLLRDRIFAQTYGLSSQLDAYNAAFLLPDLFFTVLVASGIAAANAIGAALITQKDSCFMDYHPFSIMSALLAAHYF